jgi:hypothetical protein
MDALLRRRPRPVKRGVSKRALVEAIDTHHAPYVPYVDAVRPRDFQDGFW